jgi:hypothetical protein
MALTMRRDPFARGEYERVCHGQGECAWCGQTRPRVYSYVWVRDDRTQSTAPEHRGAKTFCTFDCFRSFSPNSFSPHLTMDET